MIFSQVGVPEELSLQLVPIFAVDQFEDRLVDHVRLKEKYDGLVLAGGWLFV